MAQRNLAVVFAIDTIVAVTRVHRYHVTFAIVGGAQIAAVDRWTGFLDSTDIVNSVAATGWKFLVTKFHSTPGRIGSTFEMYSRES